MNGSDVRMVDGATAVLHPTDFSPGSKAAFAHALKVAVRNQARLTLLHATDDPATTNWHDFPPVRETLERWGLLQPGSDRGAVLSELGIKVKKVTAGGRDVVQAIGRFLDKEPVDLLVLSTDGRDGLPRWLQPSVAEPLARRAGLPTLFVPTGGRGCVSLEDGSITLERVLVPIDHEPQPHEAIAVAMRAIHAYETHGTITLFHAGGGEMPEVTPPDGDDWAWSRLKRAGEPVDAILAAADEIEADLIVMVTEGRQGFLDILRGSTTEQVLRRAPCPVMAVPSI